MEKRKSYLAFMFQDSRNIGIVLFMAFITTLWIIGLAEYWSAGAMIFGTLIFGGAWGAFVIGTYVDWKKRG